MSNTAHPCPAFRSLRTMLAPILPSPIIPSCILLFFLCAYLLQFKRRVPLSAGVQEFRRREGNFVQTCDIDRSRGKNAISELQRASSSRSATPELLQLLTPSPWPYKSLLYRRLITSPPSVCGRD